MRQNSTVTASSEQAARGGVFGWPPFYRQTSQHSSRVPIHQLRLIGQPVEKVVVGPVSSPEPHPNTWTSTPKHCNGRVFESLKDARNGPRGVFQQAARRGEVRRIHLPRTRVNKRKEKNRGILRGVSAHSLLTFLAAEAVRRR